MQTFLIIWLGQFASLLGSEMTNFAITIWAWEVTGQATPLSFILAVTQIPRLLISPFAGIWVDRFNRKHLMFLGDTVAGLSTIVLLILFLTDHLQIWHLYVSGAVNGLFGYIQGLAHSASMSLIVAEKHYARASAFESLQMSGSYVIAPAIAGAMYAVTGLSGILTIDLVTFGIAIATLSTVTIPQPTTSPQTAEPVWQQLTFGLQYLWRRPSLKVLLSFFLLSNFINSASFSLLPAMVLARLGNDSTVLGTLFSFFGAGGLLGGLTLSLWGGPKRRINGVLIFSAIWKVGLIVLALAQTVATKIGTALVSGFCSPFPGSCSQAIWRSKVEPDVQGRVFATRFLLTQLATPLGAAIAGPLADHVFEPAMQPEQPLAQLLGDIFGVGPGAGMALQMALFASCGLVVALGGYGIRRLRQIENDDDLVT
ncbi:MFS transporter [Leptothoe sp. LEGE 181152]|nr:MFS transporter [Leptothoe sp. LEGE 181152]